jgi:UvrD-like helicase C-terminal domain
VTIHKSQGSEYPAVVTPVMTQRYAMLQRNLLYTGVTRKKAGRVGRPEEGCRHRGSQRFGSPALVEVE